MNNGLLILAFLIGLGIGYLWGHAVKVRDTPRRSSTPLKVSGVSSVSVRKTAPKKVLSKKAKKRR